MSDCKLINTNEKMNNPELVRQNLLEWCKNEKDFDCEDLDKTQDDNECLFRLFTDEISDNDNFIDEINKKILEKNKTYIQLQNMENEVMDYTNERDLNLLEKINKNKIHELIYLIIYLVIAWCFGIYIIFNYLVIEK
jgi:hypothetical protein